MAEYRDPKVTTPTKSRSGGMGKWIGIILAIIVALLLLAWLTGWWDNDEVATVPADDTIVVVPEEGVVTD